jgi:hypothetical protein
VGKDLQSTNLEKSTLTGFKLKNVNLQGARLDHTDICGTDFTGATVNGETYIWDCPYDEKTNFTGVGLDSARIEPGLKESFKTNIRRIRWRNWSKDKKFYNPYRLIGLFFIISNYGSSTRRIILWFLGLSIGFSFIYWGFGYYDYYNKNNMENPGIIYKLFFTEKNKCTGQFELKENPFNALPRSFYFSIVTMTTLGFGDMYARAGSFCGYFFLTLQVICGYVLLGSLVTRLGILFTSLGPEDTKYRRVKKRKHLLLI